MTYSQLKTLTSNLMGRTSSTDAIRDNIINIARADIFDRYPFSWLLKTTTLTLATNKAVMPSDYNPKHLIKDARIVVDGVGNDIIFSQILPEERDQFSADAEGTPVIWIEYDNINSIFNVYSNYTTGDITIKYYQKPIDLSGEGNIEICPDPLAIAYKAAAMLWIAKERDETNHDRFDLLAEKKIALLVDKDRAANPYPTITGIGDVYDLGYNEKMSHRPITGYQSRG